MPKTKAPADPNEAHLVLSYENTHTVVGGGQPYVIRTRVYLLNPGAFFHGFGGSRHAKAITKTASLIIRTQGPWGMRDYETDINVKSVWQSVVEGLTSASTLRSLASAE